MDWIDTTIEGLQSKNERLQNVLANLVSVMRSGPDTYLNDQMVTSALELAEQELKK
jgi:hypothetical protein